MTISYRYYPDSNIVHCKVEEVIKTHDFLGYLRDIIGDEQISVNFIEIVDFGSATNLITSYNEVMLFS